MASALNNSSSPMSMLSYHALLLDDETRTKSFIDAISKHIHTDSVLLDIGTGTGVLAIAAAKMGAKVYAVERTDMIEFAKALAKKNNCKIEFIENDIANIDSSSIEPCDIVVSEMLGNVLLDETLITVMKNGKRFLKPDGVLIPCSARFHAALAWSPLLEKVSDFWKQERYGIDFSAFIENVSNDFYPDSSKETKILGEESFFKDLDLYKMSDEYFEDKVKLSVRENCFANSILLWWSSKLCEDKELNLGPRKEWPKQHWHRTLLPITKKEFIANKFYGFTLVYDGKHPMQIWSWNLDGETHSTFFSVPPSKKRMENLLDKI